MSYDESYFHDADAPWMPKLVDVEYFKAQTEDASKKAYFAQFGFDALDYDSTSLPMVDARFTILTQRFNQRYYNRMIGAESMERWQNRLQNRFDEIADRYERAYQLYDDQNDAMMTDVIDGERVTEKGQRSKLSGKDTTDRSSSDWDTPDSAINGTASYADRSSKGKIETTYGRTDDVDVTTERKITGANILDNVNESIRNWQDLDTAFVAEFENLFLNIFWY